MDEGEDLISFLNESTEENLAGFIKGRVRERLQELEESKRKLNEQLAAVDYEMNLLRKYCDSGTQEPSVQDLLAKLLKR